MLTNIKNSPKTIYQSSLEQYLRTGVNMIKEQISKA